MRRLGPYRILRRLAEGGMAEVWLARGPDRTPDVVLKTLRPALRGSPDAARLFENEAWIGERIDHPLVPRTLDRGEADGVAYLVQDYVEGPSLARVLERLRGRPPLDLRLCARITADVASALYAAWAVPGDGGDPLCVVHCDVSPPNVLIAASGQVRLIDFGIAAALAVQPIPSDAARKGRFLYQAPEVFLRGEVSHRSDLYSLGLVAYALCAGQAPWSGADEVAERCREEAPPPSWFRPALPPSLERIVQRMIRRDPAARYVSGREVAEDLQAWLGANGGPVTDAELADGVRALFPEGPDGWLPPAPRPARRWVWPAALGVGALGVLGASAGAALLLAWAVAPGPAAAPPSTERLLDRAEVSLRADRVDDAVRLLGALSDAPLDGAHADRRDRLRREVQLRTAVQGVRELLADDPKLARARARDLAAMFPDEPRLTRLLADVEAAVTAAGASGELGEAGGH
ncbi:MAG: serine/threonine-protein kinase [Myxococcota bacterium]